MGYLTKSHCLGLSNSVCVRRVWAPGSCALWRLGEVTTGYCVDHLTGSISVWQLNIAWLNPLNIRKWSKVPGKEDLSGIWDSPLNHGGECAFSWDLGLHLWLLRAGVLHLVSAESRLSLGHTSNTEKNGVWPKPLWTSILCKVHRCRHRSSLSEANPRSLEDNGRDLATWAPTPSMSRTCPVWWVSVWLQDLTAPGNYF